MTQKSLTHSTRSATHHSLKPKKTSTPCQRLLRDLSKEPALPHKTAELPESLELDIIRKQVDMNIVVLNSTIKEQLAPSEEIKVKRRKQSNELVKLLSTLSDSDMVPENHLMQKQKLCETHPLTVCDKKG